MRNSYHLTYFFTFKTLECDEECPHDNNYCGLELYNFDNKCLLDCENEKVTSVERKFEPIHGNQCDGKGKYDKW